MRELICVQTYDQVYSRARLTVDQVAAAAYTQTGIGLTAKYIFMFAVRLPLTLLRILRQI